MQTIFSSVSQKNLSKYVNCYIGKVPYSTSRNRIFQYQIYQILGCDDGEVIV